MTFEPEQSEIEVSIELLGQITKQLHLAIMELASQTGQSLPQVKTMFILRKHGPCPVSDVAEFLEVSPPTASEHIDRLVEAGLVERRTNPRDRRQVLVSLSPAAWDLANTWFELRCSQMRSVLSELDPEERQVFLSALSSLARVLAHDPADFMPVSGTD